LLEKHADKLILSISDTIRFSSTFRWALNDRNPDSIIPPLSILFLRSYITQDLFAIFQGHFNCRKNLYKHLFEFLQESLIDIKTHVWKLRSQEWKNWKTIHGVTKEDFKKYRQRYKNTSNLPTSSSLHRRDPRRVRSAIYINPQNDFRNYKNERDLLFILFSSSNFLHSGPFYDHIYKFSANHNTTVASKHVPFYV
jgi:hypothetical protein